MGLKFQELRPKNDTEWLGIRTQVLTASDVGVILGLNPWKSVRELLDNKKNPEPFENAYTIIGQELEPVVVTMTNRVMKRHFKLFENGSRSFFVNFDIKLGATPDAGDAFDLLECKTTKPHNYLKWTYWPPAYYLSQLYTQLLCTDRQVGYLAIMSTDLTQQSQVINIPLHIHKLTRTEKLDKIFIDTVKEFWKQVDNDKVFRVNRKDAWQTELQLRLATKSYETE